MRDEEQGKVAVAQGLPSLLRRTRSHQGRRPIAPSFWCVIVAGLLVPSVALSAPPQPDPPPPGVLEPSPTALDPDAQPDAPLVRTTSVPATTPPPISKPASPAVTTSSGQLSREAPARVSTPRTQPAGRRFANS